MWKLFVVPGSNNWLSVVVADLNDSAFAVLARSRRLTHGKMLFRQIRYVSLVIQALEFADAHYRAYWQRRLFKVRVVVTIERCTYAVSSFFVTPAGGIPIDRWYEWLYEPTSLWSTSSHCKVSLSDIYSHSRVLMVLFIRSTTAAFWSLSLAKCWMR